MENEFEAIAQDIITKRARIEHANMCAHPERCTMLDWHVENDYVPRIRREVIHEMREAIENLRIRA